jgi:hypothetical protein
MSRTTLHVLHEIVSSIGLCSNYLCPSIFSQLPIQCRAAVVESFIKYLEAVKCQEAATIINMLMKKRSHDIYCLQGYRPYIRHCKKL